MPPKNVSGCGVLKPGVGDSGKLDCKAIKDQLPLVTVALARPPMSGHGGRKIDVHWVLGSCGFLW